MKKFVAGVAGVLTLLNNFHAFCICFCSVYLYEKTLYLELKNSIEVTNNTAKGAY